MSYILDALRKAEQERLLGQPPALTPLPPLTEPARNRFWYGLTVLVLMANAVLLAFFLGRSQSEIEPPPTAPPTAPPVAQPALPDPSTQPTSPATRRSPAPPTPPAPSAPSRSRPAARPESAPPTPASTAPIPTLDALPAGVRRALPALNLDIHVYSRDADKRFAVVNGRRYREGERLSEGLVVEAVTPAGVTLRRGNQRFQLLLNR